MVVKQLLSKIKLFQRYKCMSPICYNWFLQQHSINQQANCYQYGRFQPSVQVLLLSLVHTDTHWSLEVRFSFLHRDVFFHSEIQKFLFLSISLTLN